MDTFLGRFKNLIVLAAILFAQIIGLAVQVRRPSQLGETRLIRLWAVSAVTPVESAVVHVQKLLRNTWTNYLYLRGVRRENRDLRAQIERMKIEEARLGEDARMARRVQTLLAFKEQYVENTVAAQVIGTSGSEQSRVLYIDKGAKDGIKPDMAVITPTGIVGKIVQVFPGSAQVLPINDQFSGVGVALKDTRLQGILKGAQNGATTLQYVMSDEKVEPGEEIITSGGDRIFPKGLPVGKVVTVEPGKDLFLNIRVIPSAHLDQLEEVLVVTRITEKLPDSKDLGPIRAADILAERLPTVPTKPGADGGTGKPTSSSAAGAPGGAASATVAHPSATGTASVSKPTAGTTAVPAGKPIAPAPTARNTSGTTTAGSTGSSTPGTAAGAHSASTTVPKPLNSAAPGVPSSPPPTDATPATASPPSNGDASTPAPKKTSPNLEQTPSAKPDQPAKPPVTEQPQP